MNRKGWTKLINNRKKYERFESKSKGFKICIKNLNF